MKSFCLSAVHRVVQGPDHSLLLVYSHFTALSLLILPSPEAVSSLDQISMTHLDFCGIPCDVKVEIL
jgi:hypothetical protein